MQISMPRRQSRFHRAFCCVQTEPIIALAALGVVAAILIPWLQRPSARELTEARIAAALADIRGFRAERGRWPLNLQELGGAPRIDGWGWALRYDYDPGAPTLRSLGADGRDGGLEADADILRRVEAGR